MKKAAVFVAVVCLTVLCVSCAQKPAEQTLVGTEGRIIGKWEREKNLQIGLFGVVADTLEFREDGTCYLDGIKMRYHVFTDRLSAGDETEYEILAVEFTDPSGIERKAEFEITWEPERDWRLMLSGDVPEFSSSIFRKL